MVDVSQQDMNAATKELGSLLKQSIRVPDGAKPKSWRVDPVNFVFPENAEFEPGSVDFSPAWFAARHQVIV